MLNSKGCYLCGFDGHTEVHHIMNGRANRRLCDEDGLTVKLCRRCHEQVHGDATLRKELKEVAEMVYLESHTYDEWMQRYGKNYIDTLS